MRIYFNPRAPYGARPSLFGVMCISVRFQSTRPIRGATRLSPNIIRKYLVFQSTRPIRGATFLPMPYNKDRLISIHAPHTGRDVGLSKLEVTMNRFQSTRPIRGATLPGT